MATIMVGPQKRKFGVHQALICDRSQYFNKAFTGSFHEAETGIVELKDVSPVLLQIFVGWLYYDKLIYTVLDEGSSVDEDFGSLETSIEIDPEGPDAVGEDPSTWPYHMIVELYMFADRFDVKALRIDTLDLFIDSTLTNQWTMLISNYSYIWAHTHASSSLRKLVVHELAYRSVLAENANWLLRLPKEMLVEILTTLGRRVPASLCKACHKKGLKKNKVKDPKEHGMCEVQDIAPYKLDRCFYHEHTSEEELNTCRNRREKMVKEASD
ncbi:hypothetical protein D6D01_07620 [Aureobasidium pullulans]|uniref:BTB domain-containing protein n=1 Tax=Aureobasidium pullulans TaxID=5580 RepID=A0A4S9KNA8_AURPU|nr:hypothetical protein D6D01_07620 [Aureobasidium pullulans]